MTALTFDPTELVVPSAADTVAAHEAVPRFVRALANADSTVRLRLEEPDGSNEPIAVPAGAFRLLWPRSQQLQITTRARQRPHRNSRAGMGSS